jgi:RNA-binding protein YhbY
MKHAGVVHLQLGKSGITDGVVIDINDKFRQQDPLVIKMNRTFKDMFDRKEEADRLAALTKSNVKSLVGGTLILTRKRT